MKVGLLGGGQLGRMLALAGYPFGFTFRTFDHSSESPAGQLSELIVGEFVDEVALDLFAEGLDLVTYEFENVPVTTSRFLAKRIPVYPPPEALEVAQDRLVEKNFFSQLGILTPAFVPVDTEDDLRAGFERLGATGVLKTRRFGYDGKGQHVIRDRSDASEAWKSIGGVPLLLESFVEFERELSMIAVRSVSGEIKFYPLIENHHRGGILRLSIAPAEGITADLQSLAEGYAARVLETLKYVGVLTIEFFQCEGELMANEMAPRVHNSGHWTIEGAETSQFENHLRAISGLPLGSTDTTGHSAMLNIIGSLPDLSEAYSMKDAHVHLYGKAPRTGRKIGHITIRSADRETLHRNTKHLSSALALG